MGSEGGWEPDGFEVAGGGVFTANLVLGLLVVVDFLFMLVNSAEA